MRKSRYNVETLSSAGEHLLYNTANGSFAVLSPAGYADYQAGGGDSVGPLARAGFLTELSADQELDRQRYLFCAQANRHDRFYLAFVPTYVCNYRCPYCYEKDHIRIPGFMSDAAIDAVCDFVRGRFADHAFKELSVEWYGGDPSLCLDVVEKASGKLRAFCDENGVSYDAMMLSNCNLVDDAAAKRIADCGVSLMYLTIDGPEEIHNKRRIAANGTNSYQRAIRAARCLRQHGVRVQAGMNADKVTLPLAPALRETLKREEGIDLVPEQLNDYGGTFGTGDFKAPEFDLYTHEEYARARYELFDKGKLSAADIRGLLSPQTHFCNGQKHDYYVIDLTGDVYKCDGWVGNPEHVKFNLFDDPSTWQLDIVTHDPFEDAKCRDCALVPLCHGSCIWERECSVFETGEMPCHPLKATMDDYLRDYRDCFGRVEGDVALLAKPLAEADIAQK